MGPVPPSRARRNRRAWAVLGAWGITWALPPRRPCRRAGSLHPAPLPARAPFSVRARRFRPEIRRADQPTRKRCFRGRSQARSCASICARARPSPEGDVLAAIDCAAHEARATAPPRRKEGARRRPRNTAGRLDRLSSISRLRGRRGPRRPRRRRRRDRARPGLRERCEIRAPFSGRVAREAGAGASIRRGGRAAPRHPRRRAPSRWRCWCLSRWLAWLAPGQTFHRRGRRAGRLGRGRDRADRRAGIDPVSQSIKVFGRIPQGTPGLVAGMSGVARSRAAARAILGGGGGGGGGGLNPPPDRRARRALRAAGVEKRARAAESAKRSAS